VLSVFNGFEELVLSLVNSFNPDLKIEATTGKVMHMDELPAEQLGKLPGVTYVVMTVEEKALVKYRDHQHIVTLKGVSKDFEQVSPVRDFIISGDFRFHQQGQPLAVIGAGVAYYLSIYLSDFTPPITIFMPRRTGKTYTGPAVNAFNEKPVNVSGVFSIQQEFDAQYILVPIEFLRELLEYSDEVSALEIWTMPGTDIDEVREGVASILGDGFTIKNRFQQQELLYKVMKSEKWAIFFILVFILIVATFNVIGSLSMLILDKKKDISVLWSLGADKKLIKRIFTFEGMMISFAGGIIGLMVGALLAWLQQQYGFVKLGDADGSYIIEAYPVRVVITDLVYILITVLFIGFVTVWYPVRQISRKYLGSSMNFFLMR
jgi:lipoprotein-releasing system permease protein